MTRPLPPHETLTTIVEVATTAPSVHNTQPWRWRVEDGALRLHADHSRQLMQADPDRRSLVHSCGAALHLLEVGARAHGWLPEVERHGRGGDPLLATIRFRPHPVGPDDLRLLDAARARRTDRRQVTSWPVPADRIATLAALAARHGVLAGTELDERDADVVRRALALASAEQGRSDGYHEELQAWSRPPARSGTGVPQANQPDRAAASRLEEARTRFPAGTLVDDRAADPASADAPLEPHWMLLATSSDDALSWLRAGEALAAIWLRCTVDGLSLVPYSQPAEVAEARALLRREVLQDRACPQVLVRLGWPADPDTPPPATPRRPVQEVLDLGP